MHLYNLLAHFIPMLHFYAPWKRQKTRGFLTFPMECRNTTLVGNGLVKYQVELSLQAKRKYISSVFAVFHRMINVQHLYLKHWNDQHYTIFFSKSYFLVKWKRKMQEPFQMLNCCFPCPFSIKQDNSPDRTTSLTSF